MAARDDPWSPYQPSAAAPWNLRRVVLLHRRCGFAATWEELTRDLADGPAASVDRLLHGTACARVPEEFEATQQNLAGLAIQQQQIRRLQAWWIYRMVFGPDPLGEQLTLLWHDHFATSAAKVRDVASMHAQNETLRRFARAPFRELLLAMLHDPALLQWLDAPANVKAKPNENLARELLELFTLGVGRYSEADVKEAARTLTGWSVRRDCFFENAAEHDEGEKTLLGRSGPFKTPELAEFLLAHPATSQRLAVRLLDHFLGEGVATAQHRDALAAGLREQDLAIGEAAATVLRSALFFSDANLDSRIASPIEFVVGIARGLELDRDRVSTLLLADWAARMGHELFLPPNVGGWKGGRAWLDTQGLVQRANFVVAVARGELLPAGRDWLAWGRAHDAEGGEGNLGPLLDRIAGILRGAPAGHPHEPVGTASAAEEVAALLSGPEFLLV